MQSENPLFADLVKMMNSAAGTFAGVTREARDGARERVKEAFGGLDFVTREEFDAVKDMAALAREQVEAMQAKIAALELQLAAQATARVAKASKTSPNDREPPLA